MKKVCKRSSKASEAHVKSHTKPIKRPSAAKRPKQCGLPREKPNLGKRNLPLGDRRFVSPEDG